MKRTLDDLMERVGITFPSACDLQTNEARDVVTFKWRGRRFFVKRSLKVYELNGLFLQLTTASALIQSILVRRERNSRIFENILDYMEEAHDSFDRNPALVLELPQANPRRTSEISIPALQAAC